jgi:hypothetical protein
MHFSNDCNSLDLVQKLECFHDGRIDEMERNKTTQSLRRRLHPDASQRLPPSFDTLVQESSLQFPNKAVDQKEQ